MCMISVLTYLCNIIIQYKLYLSVLNHVIVKVHPAETVVLKNEDHQKLLMKGKPILVI